MILQTNLHQSENLNKQIEPKELFNAHSNAVLCSQTMKIFVYFAINIFCFFLYK